MSDPTLSSMEVSELYRLIRQLREANAAATARNNQLENALVSCTVMLRNIKNSFNTTRLIMNDDKARELAGEIVKDANIVLDAARAVLEPKP